MHLIEFIEGEPFCRYNGVLCDPEGCTKIYGYSGDLNFLDDTTIIHEGVLYTDQDLYTVIGFISEYQGKSQPYDEMESQGRGFIEHSVQSMYDCSYIIREHFLDDFKGVKQIKPFSSFGEDHPEISIREYRKFQEALDLYGKEIGIYKIT